MSKTFTIFGEAKTLREWADDPRAGVGYATLRVRFKREADLERALTDGRR